MMKRCLSLALALALALSAAAALAEAATGLANPVHESTAEEAAKATGTYGAALPEGAQDAAYSYIDMAEGAKIFQVRFNWGGVPCVYRARSAQALEDISGMFYPWQIDKMEKIGTYDGRVKYDQGGAGVVMWLDVRNSIVYSAAMEKDAGMAKLMALSYANAEWEQEMPADGEVAPFDFFPGYEPEPAADNFNAIMGFEAKLPEGAQDVKYYVMGRRDGQGNEVPFGAVAYKLDGKAFLFYAQFGPEAFDPSNQYSPWTQFATVPLKQFQADLKYHEGGLGVINWFDSEKGINYAVAMEEGASETALPAAAEPFL